MIHFYSYKVAVTTLQLVSGAFFNSIVYSVIALYLYIA